MNSPENWEVNSGQDNEFVWLDGEGKDPGGEEKREDRDLGFCLMGRSRVEKEKSKECFHLQSSGISSQ